MEYAKTVVNPTRQVARHDSIHGLIQEYENVTQDVLLLEGGVHHRRKPGSLFFTTKAVRDGFARIVLQDVRASERVHALAEKVISRMNRLNDGRSWMAAHMRRGDCKRLLTGVLCSLY
jgi:hypothetical protein